MVSFTLVTSVFGFLSGDKIICRTEVDLNQLTKHSLVISEVDGRRELTVFGLVEPENVIAILVSFRREVEL